MNHIASTLMENPTPKGWAIHLTCDYQNFTPLKTFLIISVPTLSHNQSYDAPNSIDLSDISEAIATYGSLKQECNYLIGKPLTMLYGKKVETDEKTETLGKKKPA